MPFGIPAGAPVRRPADGLRLEGQLTTVDLPTVSVLVPNYNHAAYLEETLTALLSQSVRPLEILVVDDASTDDSLAIIERLAAADPILRVIRHETNQGAIAAINRALAEARGDYVYVNAVDDPVRPGLFEQALPLLAANPEAGLACWDHLIRYERDPAPHAESLGWGDAPCAWPPAAMPKRLQRDTIGGHNSLMRTDALRAIGGYQPAATWFSDALASTVLALRHGVCYVPQPLALYRASAAGYGSSVARRWRSHAATVRAALDLLNTPAYADVRRGFRDSAILRLARWKGLVVAAASPRYWYFITPRLVCRVIGYLFDEVRLACFPHLPQPLLRVYRGLRGLARRGLGLAPRP
jgi:glycosyltransferase involved in cell wall biosynthesis